MSSDASSSVELHTGPTLAAQSDSTPEAEAQRSKTRQEIYAGNGWNSLPISMFGKCVAEFTGTFVLVLSGASSGASTDSRTSPINITAVALAHSLALWTMIGIYGHVSGSHLNGAVTMSLTLTRAVSIKTLLLYSLSQFLGSFCAGILLLFIYGFKSDLGTPTLNTDFFTPGQGFMAELTGTFLLCSVILFTVNNKSTHDEPGKYIAATLCFCIIFLGHVSGGSLNPWRFLGPGLCTFQSATGPVINKVTWWVYLFGPYSGAILASGFFTLYTRWIIALGAGVARTQPTQ